MSAPFATTRSAAVALDLPIQIIAPARGWVPIRLRELWEYRELLYFLIWREVKIRYKQAALGIGWAVLQPFLTMVIFSIVFGRFAGLPSDGLPYPVFAFCALLPWQLFTFALTESSNSVVANQRLITKVYFPRVIMPIAAVGVGLLDFAISFIVLLCLIGFYGAYYGLTLGGYVWTVPFWALLAVMTALGVGFWLSALNVKYRDIRYTVPFLAQLWFFATPVVYPTSIVPPEWRPLFALNPMVGVVDGFRWALLGKTTAPDATVVISIGAVCAILLAGLFYFRRMERTFADVI
jgi:lipopolysaccharide transport system permease protein